MYIHSTTLTTTTTTEAAVATELHKSREKLRKQQQLSLLAEILSRTLPLRLHCLLLLLVNNIRSLCGNVIFMRTKAAFFSFQKCYRRFILCTLYSMNIADDIEDVDVDTAVFPYNMEKYVQKNRQNEKNEQQHQ